MNDPWSFTKCSPEQFQEYIKMLSCQKNWDKLLVLSQSAIDQMSFEFENYRNAMLSGNSFNVAGVDVCTVSPLNGVPGFVYGAI